MSRGYTFSLGPIDYVSHRDGTPFTLVEVWRELRGVGQARIYRPDGSLMMRDAGSMLRRQQVGRLLRAQLRNRAPRSTPLP